MIERRVFILFGLENKTVKDGERRRIYTDK